MSAMTPERPPQPRGVQPQAGRGSGFNRKLGGIPLWGWAAFAAVGAIGVWYWRTHAGTTATAATTAGTTAAATGALSASGASVLQSEIQQLQGELSTTAGTTAKKKPPVRHVSTGKETFNAIAKARGTSVAHIVSTSRDSTESVTNLTRLLDWSKHPGTKRKGIVYFTTN